MEALTSLSTFLSSPTAQSLLKIGEVGMAGSGLVGNIMNERQRSQQLNYATNAEKTLQDPTALAKQVSAATQPLNSGLVQGIENTVSGNLAEQGLSQAPGIQASTLAQSLAPFQQQNQNTALQLVLTRLGLPLQYVNSILGNMPQQTNLSPLLALIQRNNATPQTTGIADASAPTGSTWQQLFGGAPTPSASVNPASTDTGDFSLPSEVWG